LLLHDGSLAIGTIASGLVLFGPDQGRMLLLDEASGLSNNTVLALNESKDGNLWLGLDRGLDLVVRSSTISFVTGKSRPPGTVYTAAYYEGQAYFGTNQGLYLQQETTNGFAYSLIPGTSGQVWELRRTKEGLLCGHNDGTFMIRNAVARKISSRSGGWNDDYRSGEIPQKARCKQPIPVCSCWNGTMARLSRVIFAAYPRPSDSWHG